MCFPSQILQGLAGLDQSMCRSSRHTCVSCVVMAFALDEQKIFVLLHTFSCVVRLHRYRSKVKGGPGRKKKRNFCFFFRGALRDVAVRRHARIRRLGNEMAYNAECVSVADPIPRQLRGLINIIKAKRGEASQM